METVPITVMPQEKQKKEYERTCSNDTFYVDSNEGFHSKCQSAANLLQKRRQLRPLLSTGVGNPYRAVSNYGVSFISVNSPTKINMNGYSHRIMSAKLLQVKQLQNELTDAQFQLNELFTENRLLKTLQKRQDLALSKYEGTKAALPQLIHSHNEEVRFLRANIKHFKTRCREKDHQIKELDADLKNLRDQHHHLLKLSRDRHLGDREQLTKQVEELKEIIREQDVRIQTLNRKIMLETKNFKHELRTEMARHKETKRHLSEAFDRISKLEILVETKEKYIATLVPRRNFQNNNRQPVLMVPLAGRARYADLHASMKSEAELIPQLEEESSEGTYMAPNTNTSYGSTHPSTDTVEINSENHVPSDGYNARRVKLEHKRKIMLDRKLHQTVINKTDDLVTTSGLTSPTPSSSVLNDDKDTDCVDDYASKQLYSFGTVYSSRKLAENFNVDDNKKSKSEHLMKSNSEVSLKEVSEDTNTYAKTSRRRSFQENSRKDVVTNLTADIKNETRVRRDSCLSLELNPTDNGLIETLSVNKSRKGSLVMECTNYVEETPMSAITTNRSSSRRGSLAREKTNSAEEESMTAINRSSSRKGSLKKDKINFLDEESVSALGNRSVSRKASVSNKINVDVDSVKCVASYVADQGYVPSDADRTKSDAPSKDIFPETKECLTEIPQTVNKIENTFVSERDVTQDKLKQFGNNADSEPLEIKGYEKKKLLAALKAIDDEDSSIVNQGDKNSSVLDSLHINSVPNPDSSLNVSLP